MKARKLAGLDDLYLNMANEPEQRRMGIPEVLQRLSQTGHRKESEALATAYDQAMKVLTAEDRLRPVTLRHTIRQMAEEGSLDNLPKTLDFYALAKRIWEAADGEILLTEEEFKLLDEGVAYIFERASTTGVVKVNTTLKIREAEEVEVAEKPKEEVTSTKRR
jgi:hypothetical protein